MEQPAEDVVMEVRVSAETLEGLRLSAGQRGISEQEVVERLAAKAASAARTAARADAGARAFVGKLSEKMEGVDRQKERFVKKFSELKDSELDREALDRQISRTADKLKENSRRLGQILRRRLGDDWSGKRGEDKQ